MKDRAVMIKLPVGRMVQGSLYEPTTTDMETKPLVGKTGKPAYHYFFAVAIQKGTETHWNQTPWGAKIWEIGHRDFPNGKADSPTFAWKIADGDSVIPNHDGKRPCDNDGFPGHWVVKLKTATVENLNDIKIPIVNANGSEYILTPDFVNCGDYIETAVNVKGNESPIQSGVYLNPLAVAFNKEGERISQRIDPRKLGFGNSELPSNYRPPVSVLPSSIPAAVAPPSASVPPYPAILTPPVPPVVPQRTMTAKAQGASYDQMISAGWTDVTLLQHGMMLP